MLLKNKKIVLFQKKKRVIIKGRYDTQNIHFSNSEKYVT